MGSESGVEGGLDPLISRRAQELYRDDILAGVNACFHPRRRIENRG